MGKTIYHPLYYRYDIHREGRCLVASNCTPDLGWDCTPDFYGMLVTNQVELESVVRLYQSLEALDMELPPYIHTSHPLRNILVGTLSPHAPEDKLTATVLSVRRKRCVTRRRSRP